MKNLFLVFRVATILVVVFTVLITGCGQGDKPVDGQGDQNSEPIVSVERKAGEEITFEVFPGVVMEFVWIPSGTYQMGSSDREPEHSSDEGPLHWVDITQGFWMGKYEVTQGQWLSVMGFNPSHFDSYGPNWPVEQISMMDAIRFMGKFSQDADKYYFPTEAQWEYACRAGVSSPTSGASMTCTEMSQSGVRILLMRSSINLLRGAIPSVQFLAVK